MRPNRALALTGLIALLIAGVAHAQWKWRDASGQLHYSDQPPPAGVPDGRILKSATPAARPGTAAPAAPGPAAAAGPGAPEAGGRTTQSAASPAAGGTGGDAELALRRRQLEREAADKKAAAEAQRSAQLARACEDLRANLRTLESGMRVARVNAQGEQEFLSDEERAARIDSTRRELRANCTTS